MVHSEGTAHLTRSLHTEKLGFKEHVQLSLGMVG